MHFSVSSVWRKRKMWMKYSTLFFPAWTLVLVWRYSRICFLKLLFIIFYQMVLIFWTVLSFQVGISLGCKFAHKIEEHSLAVFLLVCDIVFRFSMNPRNNSLQTDLLGPSDDFALLFFFFFLFQPWKIFLLCSKMHWGISKRCFLRILDICIYDIYDFILN